MLFDDPEKGEILSGAYETYSRRPHIIDAAFGILESTPVIQQHLAEITAPAQPQESDNVTYVDFVGRRAVENADAASRITDAQQAIEKSYGDQKAV